ncbi:MAG: 50S ribosomal protein L29 [Gammaproteobacteria bacterium RIFCSPHIGHO2_12_FULL_45_9]|nr:MAG: 50S ribosomal protein L29 [Gammaproteobacteria bacterium RIFCSPHIGHO2_12_FULL_45_9]
MKAVELVTKTVDELKGELLVLRRELLNLKMQKSVGTTVKPHLFTQARRNIARVKTVLTQKGVCV